MLKIIFQAFPNAVLVLIVLYLTVKFSLPWSIAIVVGIIGGIILFVITEAIKLFRFWFKKRNS